jgi:amino acid permease
MRAAWIAQGKPVTALKAPNIAGSWGAPFVVFAFCFLILIQGWQSFTHGFQPVKFVQSYRASLLIFPHLPFPRFRLQHPSPFPFVHPFQRAILSPLYFLSPLSSSRPPQEPTLTLFPLLAVEIPFLFILYWSFRLIKGSKTPSLLEIDLVTGEYMDTQADIDDNENIYRREKGRYGFLWVMWGWVA